MRKLAGWSFSHRRVVLGIWLVVVIGFSVIHGAAGSAYKDSFKLSGTDSADAQALLQQNSPQTSGDVDHIVIATEDGKSITDPGVKSEMTAMLDKVAKLPHVGSVVSPYAPGAAAQISKDGRIAYATVTFDELANELPESSIERVITVAQGAANEGVQVQLGGQAIEQTNKPGVGGTAFGFLAAAIVLFLVFGSLFAMLMPLLTAGFALGTGVAVIGLLSHAITMASFSSELSLLIGLGVGVDYALFIVTRFRQGLMRGLSPEEAIADSLDTSGRAVLFAGITVCIALLGMFTLGVSFLYGVAIAASVVVAMTVIAALTLLPALLGFAGLRILSRKDRRALAEGTFSEGDESPAWRRWAGTLQRRPALFAAGAAVLLLVIAIPFLSIRLGSSDEGNDASGTTTRQAYDLLAEGFGPGFNGPLQLVAAVPNKGAEEGFDRVLAAAKKTEDVVAVTPAKVIPGTDGRSAVATANVVPAGSPQDASTTDLLHRLRDETVPDATANGGPNVLVGGQTAIFEDFSGVLSQKLPLFIGVVVLLSFLLLMAVFRSIVVPAMASVMNLLSAGAAFGVITAVFQWGWGASLIGVDRTGPIEAFLPVMVFAILFGLSMDYEVFLVSRIYEEWRKRGDNREAVIHGLAATARTITAAAAIMVLVFGAFVLGGERVIELFGIGLASAVFLDAVIVRSVLVPSLMLLTGKANWWLPAWLDRILPHLNVEGSTEGSSSPSSELHPRETPVTES
jgi:putative drug exporter of the RND superfamily